MKNSLNLNEAGLLELSQEELRIIDGGIGGSWVNLLWMVLEDALELWGEASAEFQNWAEQNPDQVLLYRSLHH